MGRNVPMVEANTDQKQSGLLVQCPRPKPVLAMLASAMLAACGGGSGSTAAAPPISIAPSPAPTPTPTPTPTPPTTNVGIVEREILPALANPVLTTFLSANFIVRPDGATARGRLFVMLPGTTAIPQFYRDIVRTGAERGYHGIGLSYPNAQTVASFCTTSVDPDCIGKARAEIITGTDTSPVVTITPANSIAGRLADQLRYLHRIYPGEGWDQFLRGGEPDWSRISLAGHSQGAGHAGYAAKLFSLNRVAMFAGPGDTGMGLTTAAAWLSLPNVTPPDRQYGFTHINDELVPVALLVSNWASQGLASFGGAVSVDGSAAPFGGARQLTTALPPNPNPPAPVPSPAHSSPVVDAVTPRDTGGLPLYRNVWIYMAFPDS